MPTPPETYQRSSNSCATAVCAMAIAPRRAQHRRFFFMVRSICNGGILLAERPCLPWRLFESCRDVDGRRNITCLRVNGNLTKRGRREQAPPSGRKQVHEPVHRGGLEPRGVPGQVEDLPDPPRRQLPGDGALEF